MTYTIAFSSESISDLTEKVNNLISEGWRPQGGVSVTSHTFVEIEEIPTVLYLQAMIRE